MRRRRRAVGVLLLLAFGLSACGRGAPRAVVLHEEQCAYCRMEVGDARFAAEAVTRTGVVHVFDSADCLVGYVHSAAPGSLRGLWVSDAERPGSFVAVDSAGFLIGSLLRAPMGRVVAFASPTAARVAQGTYGGTLADWATVLADTVTAAARDATRGADR